MTFPMLVFPDTLAAFPGPGNTDPQVLYSLCLAGTNHHLHMQKGVIRGIVEWKNNALYGHSPQQRRAYK